MITLAFNLDPTRTSLQRRSFTAEMAKRFRAVQRAVWHLIANDAVIVNATREKLPNGVAVITNPSPEELNGFGKRETAGQAPLRFVVDKTSGDMHFFNSHKAIHHDAIKHFGIKDYATGFVHPHEGNFKISKFQVEGYAKDTQKHLQRFVTNAFDFATDPDKIDHFQKWLQRQINLHILETRTATGNPSLKKPWLAPRIINAYKIGIARAYTDVKRAGGSPPTAGLNLTSEMKRAMDSAFEAGKLQRHLEAGMAMSTRKVELIYTRAYHDLQGITQYMSAKLSRILATGMINGDSPHSMARKMVQQISGISLHRARLIATTELTAAHASGTLDGLEMQGVKRVTAQVEFQTVGDDRVCPKCKHLEGKRFTIEEARGKIPVHPNCVLPTTLVSARGFVAAIRSFYGGNVVEITTRSGARITVTENHQLLGLSGFVLAKGINKGDYLIRCPVSDLSVDDPHNYEAPALASEVFNTTLMASSMGACSVPVSPEYLHGDGVFCEGKIDVVPAEGFLRSNFKSPPLKLSHHLPFCAAWNGSKLNSLSRFDSMLVSMSLASHGIVRSFDKSLPSLDRGLSHSGEHSGGPVSGDESCVTHSKFQSSAANANPLGSLLERFSSLVSLDQVVHINRHSYEGHVYDLQTVSGLYIGSNLLSSNCRCAWSPV